MRIGSLCILACFAVIGMSRTTYSQDEGHSDVEFAFEGGKIAVEFGVAIGNSQGKGALYDALDVDMEPQKFRAGFDLTRMGELGKSCR